MTKEKVDGIIFDLDGTLWDSTEIILKVWNDAANDFKEINDERNFRNGGNSEAKKESKTGLYLKVNSFSNNNLIEEIKLVLAECQGKEAVYLYAEDTRQLYKWNGIYVDINDKTIYRLESLLPKDNIKIKS